MVAPEDKKAELLNGLISKLPLGVDKNRFRIFLFGPALNVDEVVAEPSEAEGVDAHARFLRYYIAKELREQGWLVDFGESSDVYEAWVAHRAPVDPGKMEYDHAFHACGAIVILPSSPGSFCEMGLFASSKEISSKTLALVHAEFENAVSFFRRGLVRIFQQRNGRCIYKSYRDKRSSLDAVLEFVEDRYKAYQWDDLDINVGEKRRYERSSPGL